MQRRPLQQRRQRRALSEAAEVGRLLPTRSIATMPVPPAISACPHCGSRAALHLRRFRTEEFRRRHQSACHLGSSRLQPRTSAVPSPGIRAVDCPVRLRVDYAFSCLREDDEGWVDGWRSQLSCSVSRQATLGSDLYSAREPPPEKQKKSPRHSNEKALGSDQHSWRPTDKLQTLFLEPWSSTWLRSMRFCRPP